jgi:hypothetical protein
VLTNYHVLEGLILGKLDPASFTCRFDYKVLADGSRKEGEVVKIQHVLDFSKYSQAEADNDPDREMPNLEELDHALIRLSHAIGSEPVGKKPAPPRSQEDGYRCRKLSPHCQSACHDRAGLFVDGAFLLAHHRVLMLETREHEAPQSRSPAPVFSGADALRVGRTRTYRLHKVFTIF